VLGSRTSQAYRLQQHHTNFRERIIAQNTAALSTESQSVEVLIMVSMISHKPSWREIGGGQLLCSTCNSSRRHHGWSSSQSRRHRERNTILCNVKWACWSRVFSFRLIKASLRNRRPPSGTRCCAEAAVQLGGVWILWKFKWSSDAAKAPDVKRTDN